MQWEQFTAPLSTDPDVLRCGTYCTASFVRVEINTSQGVTPLELLLYPGVMDHEAKLTNAFIFDNFDLKWHANGRSYCGWPEHDASRCQILRIVSLADIDEIIRYSVEKLEPPVVTSIDSPGYMNVAPSVATFFDMCLPLPKTDITGESEPIYQFIERLRIPAELVGRTAHSYGCGRYELCVDRAFPALDYLSSYSVSMDTADTVSYTEPNTCKVMPIALIAVIKANTIGRRVSLHDHKLYFEYDNMLNVRRGAVPRFDPFKDEIEFPANFGACGWIASRLYEAYSRFKIPHARTENVSTQPYKVHDPSYSEFELSYRLPLLVGGENSAFRGRT